MQRALPVPGDVVWIRRRRWRVERARRDRHVVRIDVAARQQHLTFLSPFDRVFVQSRAPQPRRVRPQQALARLAHLLAHADDPRLPLCAVSADASILPHQLEPVMAMLAGRARILLADEVGLGKTVQAGLAIAELVRREPAPRILVIAPAALRDQWAEEIGRRFRVPTVPADRPHLDALARAGAFGDNPWRGAGVWVASADFLKQPHVRDALPLDPWDLVVIDEAHAVCGDSDRHDVCQAVASRSRHVFLLTATPHNGDDARFHRLLGLGAAPRGTPAGGMAGDSLLIFRRTRETLGWRPPRRVRWHRVRLAECEVRVLAALRAFEAVVARRSRNIDDALLLLSVFRKRALSTMWALTRSIERRLGWLGESGSESVPDWMQPQLEFGGDSDLADGDEREGLTVQSGLGMAQERSWLRRIRGLADEAAREERKIERLVSILHRSAEPVVIFTEFRDSLEAIRRRLRFSRPISTIHGGLDAGERRQQLHRFLDGSTSILLATDVAGQGLNLQSRARWVVSLELPWNPARLEQRIGRVDRIGQQRATHFTLLVARDPAESGLLANLSRRVLCAQRSFSADALSSVVPPAASIRAALLLHAEVPDAATAHPAPLAICRRWVRPARAAARMLRRRRELARAWRAPDATTGGAIRCAGGRADCLLPGTSASALVYSVPLLGKNDELIGRCVVAVAVDAGAWDPHRIQSLAARTTPLLARAAGRRVAIAGRFVTAAFTAAAHRERALMTKLDDEFAWAEFQPGLFDRRETRAFDARGRDRERAQTTAGRRTDSGRQEAVRAGEPVLEIVFHRRP